jgi:hypothetical protein
MRDRLYVGSAALLLVLVIAWPASGQDAASELSVTEMAFGTGYDYENRGLIDEGSTFPAGVEVVWCRTRIEGAATATTVTHVWYRDGKTMARVELAIGSPNYRTVSSKKLLPEWTGRWEVKVLDSAGTVLRSESFTVE